MEELLKELEALNDGARFRRADLHIHSYGGSPDVTDQNQTPEKIVDRAIELGLEVISITDHHTVDNVEKAIEYAKGKDLFVVPGVELSTNQGHLLLYTPNLADLKTVLARLEFSGDMCTCTIPQCLDKATDFGGFGIAAHIEKDKGFEIKVTGYGEDKKQIFLHKHLLGIELSNADNLGWYTSADNQEQRRNFADERRKALNESSDYCIAHVVFSDAHQNTRVGMDASGDERLTRLKMDELSFGALKTAFIDPGARVRAEKLIPKRVSKFTGLKIEGGFLDGQTIALNGNLTCIIGGRGTGKSTLLESLRAVSGNPSNSGLIDSDVWPERISLTYQDETGASQMLVRDKYSDVANISDPINGLVRVPIESYGQGDTAKTIKNSDENPGVLLDFLDHFVEIDEYLAEDEIARTALLENQTAIEATELETKQTPEVKRRYAHVSSQLALLKAKKAAQLIKYEQALIQEKDVREEVGQDLKNLEQQITANLTDKQSLENIQSITEATIVAGKEELAKIKELAKTFEGAMDSASSDLDAKIAPVVKEIHEKLSTWKTKEAQIQQKIDKIKEGLAKAGIDLDFAFIRKVVQDEAGLAQKLKDLAEKDKQLKELHRNRVALIQRRKTARQNIYNARLAFSIKLNKVFAETVDDYSINLKYREGVHSPELKELLQEIMGWRTNQVPRAQIIASNLTIFDLLKAVKDGATSLLEGLKDASGNKIFTRADAKEVLDRFGDSATLYKLQRCKTDDCPQITVSKQIKLEDGTIKAQVKDFGKLSLGQQQSVILTILLFSDTTVPLIIDQPEDDLDSEFIFKTLVKNLRRVKERRQVILVTHNANIAVLGDAELILPLRGSSDKSVVRDRGSIDNQPTKDITCTILEGSKEAFMKRKNLYGL